MRRDPLPEIVEAPPGEIRTLLRQVLGKVCELHSEVVALRGEVRALRAPLSAADRETLEALLPKISAAVGSESLTCDRLLEYAELDAELLAAIEHATGGALHAATAKRLGKLLARGTGRALGDFRIVRGDPKDGAVQWSVLSDEVSNLPTLLAPPA